MEYWNLLLYQKSKVASPSLLKPYFSPSQSSQNTTFLDTLKKEYLYTYTSLQNRIFFLLYHPFPFSFYYFPAIWGLFFRLGRGCWLTNNILKKIYICPHILIHRTLIKRKDKPYLQNVISHVFFLEEWEELENHIFILHIFSCHHSSKERARSNQLKNKQSKSFNTRPAKRWSWWPSAFQSIKVLQRERVGTC